MEAGEQSNGAEANGSGLKISDEFGPEQTRLELESGKRKVLDEVEKALRFAYECGYKAAQLNVDLERGYEILVANTIE